MGYTSTDHQLQHVDDPPPDAVTVASGSSFEVLCGVLGIALAVVGILGYHPQFVGATATVALGLGLFALAGTIAARTNRCSQRDELLGISADLVAGLAGVALGALVLLRIVPDAYLPIATMALGCGLMFAARVDLSTQTPGLNVWSLLVMLVAAVAALLALFAFAAISPMTTISLVAIACLGGGLVLAGGGTLTTLCRTTHGAT